MDKPLNPFEHHHHHDSDDAVAPLDPAQESLADALRVSFFFLKIVMVLVLVWYLFSGFFNVEEQEVAVRLRFGNIVGDSPAEQVIGPGGPHLSMPPPIGQVIEIATNPPKLELDEAFMVQLTDEEKTRSLHDLGHIQRPLNPERDSYVVTGDANIVHMKWEIQYDYGVGGGDRPRVIDWLRNVGDKVNERRIIRAATERGIVRFAAGRKADELIDGLDSIEEALVTEVIQGALDDMKTGLVVKKVSANPLVPPPVQAAFNEVSEALSNSRRANEQAEKDRREMLNNVAGGAHESLWRLIRAHAVASEGEDEQQAAAAEAALAEAFMNLNTGPDHGGVDVRGQAAQIINDANSYRTRVRERLAGDAKRFQGLLPAFEQAPRITATALWEKAMQRIMKGRVRVFYVLRDGRIVIQANPDPRQKMKWQEQDMKEGDQIPEGGSGGGP